MSKVFNYKEFISNKIVSYDEISNIENVLPDDSVVEEPSSGRIFNYEDYYKVGTVTYPNYTINKKDDKNI